MERGVIWAVWLGVTAVGAAVANGQNLQQVQPIVLTASPADCLSPAQSVNQLVALPCGDRTYLSPQDRDPTRITVPTSRLLPLPSQSEWRGYESRTTTTDGAGRTVSVSMPATTGARLNTPPVTTVSMVTPSSSVTPSSLSSSMLPTSDQAISSQVVSAQTVLMPSVSSQSVTTWKPPIVTCPVDGAYTTIVPAPTQPCPPAVSPVPTGYVLGTGIVGQPTLYKPGQPVRNFFRYITL